MSTIDTASAMKKFGRAKEDKVINYSFNSISEQVSWKTQILLFTMKDLLLTWNVSYVVINIYLMFNL